MHYEACLRAAWRLSRDLADGKRLSSVCPICLLEFAYRGVLDHGPRLREDCQEVFDGCVLMLMTPRTPDELARLQRRPGHCRRHQVRANPPINELLRFITESLEFVVSEGLHSGDNAPAVRALNTRKAFANSAGRWPMRLDQLLPFGAAQAVKWLLDLAEQRISGAPLAMLGNCVIMARGVVLPVVLADNHRTRLATILCSTFRMAASGERWRQDPRTVAAACLDAFRNGPGFMQREFDCLVAGCEAELYEATCEAVLGAPDSLGQLDALVACCAQLHDMLGTRAPRPAPARVQPHLCPPNQGIFGAVLPQRARATLAHVLIVQATGAARCAAPGCGLAVLQSGDRAKFRVCAGCRVLRYCSRGCQARAWRDGSLPHRAVCHVLCKVAAQTHADPADPAFARALSELSEGEVEVLNAWLTACREEFGTLSELVRDRVDVRDPLRFAWKFLRYMSMAPRRRITDIPDELRVRVAEFAARVGGRRALVAMALVSRAFNRAATQVLYRNLCLGGQRQARILLAMLEQCDTNGTYSPPLLRLVTSFSSHKDLSQLPPPSSAGLAARILDACPNTRHIRTSADSLFLRCQTQRQYESLFLGMYLSQHWSMLMQRAMFARLQSLHVSLSWELVVFADPSLVFEPANFPALAYVSLRGPIVIYESRNVPFFKRLCGAMLSGLPLLRRIVLWIPGFVSDVPAYFRPVVQELCRCKDERICIGEGMDAPREFPMWKAYVDGRVDPWAFGTPVAQLL